MEHDREAAATASTVEDGLERWTHDGSSWLEGMSGDGRYLLVAQDQWEGPKPLLRIDRHTAEQLELPPGWHASLSADGQVVASTSNDAITVHDAASGETRTLTPVGPDETIGRLVMDPDGERIVFVATHEVPQSEGDPMRFDNVWSLEVETGDARLLTVGDDGQRLDRFIRSGVVIGGSRAAFVPTDEEADRSGETDVEVVDLESGSVKTVTVGVDPSVVSLSADGRKLFTSHGDDSARVTDIDTGDVEPVTVGPGGEVLSGSVDVTPDGRYAAFIADGTAYRRDLIEQSTEIVSVTSEERPARAFGHGLAISADGSHVAFLSDDPTLGASGSMDLIVRDVRAGWTRNVCCPGAHASRAATAFSFNDDGTVLALVGLFGANDIYTWVPSLHPDPVVRLSAAPVDENDSAYRFDVRLDHAVAHDVVVEVRAGSGTATAGVDFTPLTRTVVIPAGRDSIGVSGHLHDDALDEYDEVIELSIVSVHGGEPGTHLPTPLVILDDDQPPELSAVPGRAHENQQTLTVEVQLSAASGKPVEVDYTTKQHHDDLRTARPGEDYRTTTGTLIIQPGATVATISIPLIDDQLPELTELFTLNLLDPQNAQAAKMVARQEIIDNDLPFTLF